MNTNQYSEQAAAIATLADSIASGRLVGPRHAAVARLVDMVDTLKAWTEDDRSQAASPAYSCAACDWTGSRAHDAIAHASRSGIAHVTSLAVSA